jgi:hypothetical protein
VAKLSMRSNSPSSSVVNFLRDDAGRLPLILFAVLLLLLPGILDLEVLGAAAKPLTNTIAAIFSVIGVLVTARLINRWTAEREEEQARQRFQGLSRIAFRSLSQVVNDVGRMILAPPLGIDLRLAGIPGFTAAEVDEYMAARRAAGMPDAAQPKSGFWAPSDNDDLAKLFRVLATQSAFAPAMFVVVSKARRRLQDAFADWAPVMVSVPQAMEELEHGWELSDCLVRLLERMRTLALSPGSINPSDIEHALAQYLLTVSEYRQWLEMLQIRAQLPSKGYAPSEGSDFLEQGLGHGELQES